MGDSTATKCCDQSETPRGLRVRIRELENALFRDATGLWKAVRVVLQVVGGYRWATTSRGSYAWDDSAYQEEFGRCLDRIEEVCIAALRRSDAYASIPPRPPPATPEDPMELRAAVEMLLAAPEKADAIAKEAWVHVTGLAWGDATKPAQLAIRMAVIGGLRKATAIADGADAQRDLFKA